MINSKRKGAIDGSCTESISNFHFSLWIIAFRQINFFFSLLLCNAEIKREVLGIFAEEIYKSLREA